MKDTKFYVPVITLSARDNQKLSNFLVKDLKDQPKMIQMQQINLDFS